MADLQPFQAKICYTVATQVFHQGKILLVKHKKLGIWLCPGGHIEDGEMPHKAAERETLEETGLVVQTYGASVPGDYDGTEFLPTPIYSNVHWISKENYEERLADPEHYQPKAPWQRGCEQHHLFVYVAKPTGKTDPTRQVEEVDDIGWFTKEEVKKLATTDVLKAEILYGFTVISK